ncbi:LAFE_0H06436g1_1 [Lachancea fermentati]|uniref:LAFE_0H06436g1_1 n=1 Tax=Lachancea fermentati TaxID=4955 RepID=A0A1G4MJR9_LACFM|nr:LAFE_0H06436g1_1 [Lachancea fermentati]
MRLFENTYEFSYPWEQVTAANWKKYPNEVSTHVVAVDVLRRELHDSGKKLKSERLITVKQSVPKWLLMMVGGTNVSYVREVSVVDLDDKTLTLRSCNLTCANLLRVYETVTYKPNPDDPMRTIFEQEAQITAYASITKLCNKIEEWSVKRFHDNAQKGKKGFDSVLQILSEHWEQRDKYVDDFGNSIVDKVNDTVDDLKITTENLIKETEKKSSILNQYYRQIQSAFSKTA